ncbi:hypothetical protein [Candidatus Finniella inopinata]|uniref:Methyltransferase n=1 Tax=Candidatus Finniella inopinata TaxID=1696036 RepID=A0A4V2DZV6_9PROT|nr:hypothetical protein EQU50_02005 [Candidatus Finniella inopinata]
MHRNILWQGKVAEEDPSDLTLPSVKAFNKIISTHKKIEKCLLPIGDGMLLIRKKS